MAGPDERHTTDDAPVHDRTRTLGAILAGWLVPGLGHVILGHTKRGAVFAALILGSFGLGLAHDGRLAMRDESQPILSTLQVIANTGIGVPDLAARMVVYREAAYTLADEQRNLPWSERRREKMRERTRSGVANYGTAYLWTAGLMNLLLLFEVWDIGRGRKA